MSNSRPVAYDLEDFSEYVDLKRFQYCLFAYSGTVLAIATDSSLVLTDDTNTSNFQCDDVIRLVLEFNENSGRASCIQWIIEGEVVAVGFETGLLVCFNCKGEEIWEFKGSSSAIQSIKVASTAIHKMGAAVWLLYEEGLLITFPVGQVLDGNVTNLTSYRLLSHKRASDFVFFPRVYKTSVFDLEDLLPPAPPLLIKSSSGPTKSKTGKAPSPKVLSSTPNALVSVCTGGSDSSLAVFNLCGLLSVSDNDRAAASVRDSAVNLLSKSVMSIYNWYGGSADAASGSSGTAAVERKTDALKVQESTLVVTARVEFKDIKRRVLKLSADPSGDFVAASDSLGRVTLFDAAVGAVVRVWKGLRHAELAWTTRQQPSSRYTASPASAERSTHVGVEGEAFSVPYPAVAANLVIHAPLLGLVYVYAMPHGPCVRIVPVGLNCHIFSMSVAPAEEDEGDSNNSGRWEVRAYLLKPQSDKHSLELSEVRPADQAATDLDVRLTLVGAADEDDDYLVGEGSDEDADEQPESRGLSLSLPGQALTRETLQSRRSFASASKSASEASALQNIELSLQILVEAIPLTALRSSELTETRTSLPQCVQMSRDLFDISVERAEESVLELLNAHKTALGMNALYKIMTMIECAELFGELAPPSLEPGCSDAELEERHCAALNHAIAQYGGLVNSGFRRLLNRGPSSASVLSLTSELSAPSQTPSVRGRSNSAATSGGSAGDGAMLVALLRYPAFSAHLHRTITALLLDAIRAHENAGKHKYQYDIAKGEVTHLPAPVIQYLSEELPLRLQSIGAYDTFLDLGATAERTRIEMMRQNAGFSALQALNLRQLFDRSASVAGAAGTPASDRQQFSVLSGLSPMAQPGGPTQPAVGIHRHTLNDEISAVCKLSTTRAEAMLWALRAAQNAELSAARQASVRRAQQMAVAYSADADRATSADSGTSVLSRASLLLGSTAVATTASSPLTPSGSAANVLGNNSHSTIKRIVGKDSTPLARVIHTVDSDGQSFPMFPTEFSKRSGALDISGELVRSSRAGSNAGSESHSIALEGEEVGKVSYSVFRAFHLAHRSVKDMDRGVQWSGEGAAALVGFYSAPSGQDGTVAATEAHMRTAELLAYVMRSECGETRLWASLGCGGVSAGQSDTTGVRATLAVSASVSAVSSPTTGSPRQSAQRHLPRAKAAHSMDVAAREVAELFSLPCTHIETTFSASNNSSITSTSLPFTLRWVPPFTAPRALLQLLVSPLTGDIFSLNSLHAAMATMGVSHKLLGLQHMAPMFCAHLARQSAQCLITEVLVKKLSTFPFQRWLRDSLLTFQDSLTAAEAERTDRGRRSVSQACASPVSPVPGRYTQVRGASPSRTRSHDEQESRSLEEESEFVDTLAAQVRHQRVQAATGPAGNNMGSSGSSDADSASELPAYNEFIRHILRPAWLYAHQCGNLEAVLTFAAFVLETLHIVNDQVERRTYGVHSLKGTIASWENLARQTRLVLLLRSRTGASDSAGGTVHDGSAIQRNSLFTVQSMSSSHVSLHRLLAADTLGFAIRAEQALEHEEKCREVYARSSYQRRLSSHNSTTGSVAAGTSPDTQQQHRSALSSAATKSEVLLAWGPVADKRWKDLLAVAVAEDAIQAALLGEVNPPTPCDSSRKSVSSNAAAAAEQARKAEDQKRTLKRRRPLLLYFPTHSQAHLLGAYRSIILAERWTRAIHRVDMLVCACQHLFSLPQGTWRAAMASHLYMTHIFPVFSLFVALEEDPHLLAIVSAGGALPSTEGAGNLNQHAVLDPHQIQSLLKVVGDMRLLKSFVNAAAELLGFIEASVQQQAKGSKGASLMEHPDVQESLHALREAAQRGPFHDEAAAPVWPSQEDAFLNRLLVKYAREVSGDSRRAALWTAAAVAEQVGMLWVMHLRSLCALRGVKPTEVLGSDVLLRLRGFEKRWCLFGFDTEEANQGVGLSIESTGNNQTSTFKRPPTLDLCEDLAVVGVGVQNSVRMEFLTQCLRQLVTARQPTGVVYVLALRWTRTPAHVAPAPANSSTNSALLSLDAVRLQHLRILLAAGGGSRDEEAEQMVPQIADSDRALDTLIEALRSRMGQILAHIDRLPAFGPLIAAMDAEAVAWARGAVMTTASGPVSHSENLQAEKAAAAGLDVREADLIAICKGLNINIASTRHLVICVQSNLLNVPANLRRPPSSAIDEAPSLSDAYSNSAAVTWFQRKTRCDALLALCKYFAQQIANRST